MTKNVQAKLQFEIWDASASPGSLHGGLLGTCYSHSLQAAISYARKRYPDHSVFVCRKPKE